MGEYIIALARELRDGDAVQARLLDGRIHARCARLPLWRLLGLRLGGAQGGREIIALITQTNPCCTPPQTGDPNNAPVKTGWELSNELEDNLALFKAVKADILAK